MKGHTRGVLRYLGHYASGIYPSKRTENKELYVDILCRLRASIRKQLFERNPKFALTGSATMPSSAQHIYTSRECTMRYERALRHTRSILSFETSRSAVAVNAPPVRPNSLVVQLAVPNDSRYARLVTNLEIEQAKEG
ncbi:hypothetical protein TNCV_3492641 [Trichonephila clavipes]|nr:hypothetical protein TNCV_3492641 [Trichonephila clavipes]